MQAIPKWWEKVMVDQGPSAAHWGPGQVIMVNMEWQRAVVRWDCGTVDGEPHIVEDCFPFSSLTPAGDPT